ncbi:MAG: SDR family oxidoreductase [Chloroflexi bacterium]|nr:SDR family oxidoreductase [Chloroflexota bacterium]
MDMRIEEMADKAAFITGGASGIGLGVARAFAEVGVKLALADIDVRTLETSAAELRESGATVITVPLDVTDRVAWGAAVKRVPAEIGPVQLLVNNAGISTNGMRFGEISPEFWDKVVAINLTGIYNGVHYFLDGMRAAGGGHIVSTSSIGGLMGFPLLSGYSATKAGVIALSEALRAELADAGIGVSVLIPGGVRTRFWRTSRLARGLPDTDVPPDDQSGQSALAAMLPEEVGRRVLQGIIANDPYIMTEAAASQIIDHRGVLMKQACDKAAAFIA